MSVYIVYSVHTYFGDLGARVHAWRLLVKEPKTERHHGWVVCRWVVSLRLLEGIEGL